MQEDDASYLTNLAALRSNYEGWYERSCAPGLQRERDTEALSEGMDEWKSAGWVREVHQELCENIPLDFASCRMSSSSHLLSLPGSIWKLYYKLECSTFPLVHH